MASLNQVVYSALGNFIVQNGGQQFTTISSENGDGALIPIGSGNNNITPSSNPPGNPEGI